MTLRIIKFSDILNHPNHSFSVNDYIEQKIIKIDKNEAIEIQKLLDGDFEENNEVKYSTIKTYTVKFNDGFEADIKICFSTDDYFIDPVLFDKNGCEVCLLEPEYEFLGEYLFEFKNKEYRVLIEKK